jgi:hypothetical protein
MDKFELRNSNKIETPGNVGHSATWSSEKRKKKTSLAEMSIDAVENPPLP